MKLIWKEWRQQRWIFGLGTLAGMIFTFLQAWWQSRHNQYAPPVGGIIVMCFGASFAIILAAATAADDLCGGPETFWQSRPVSPRRMLLVKFRTGAILLLLSFLLIEAIDGGFALRLLDARSATVLAMDWQALCYTWPIALMLFAVVVFFAVLTHDTAKTVFLAIWIGLLVYFLPMLVNSLSRFNIFEFLAYGTTQSIVSSFVLAPHWYNEPSMPLLRRLAMAFSKTNLLGFLHYLEFLVLTLGPTAIFLALTGRALRRRWRWEPQQKTIVWAMGLSGAFIFGLAMFQIGQNLEPVRTWQGKSFNPTMPFNSPAEKTYDWLDPKLAGPIVPLLPEYYGFPARTTTEKDLMFRVRIMPEKFVPYQQRTQRIRHDWLLDIYRLPATAASAQHLATVRFFSLTQGPWSSNIVACFVRKNHLFVVYQAVMDRSTKFSWATSRPAPTSCLRLLVANVEDPSHPQLVSNGELYRPRHFGIQGSGGPSNYGDYCYLGLADELLVLDAADPRHPQIINKIPKDQLGFSTADDSIPNSQFSVAGNKLLCIGRNRLLLLDLTDPQRPRKEFYRRFFGNMDIGDRAEWIGTATYADRLLYVSRYGGIDVYQLTPQSDGSTTALLLGCRTSTPLERLTGRDAEQLLLEQGRLIEAAGRFGVLVYDVSDPRRPRRIYHGDARPGAEEIGTWQGMFYVASPGYSWGQLQFLDLPWQNARTPQATQLTSAAGAGVPNYDGPAVRTGLNRKKVEK